jgi:hypothetical protein
MSALAPRRERGKKKSVPAAHLKLALVLGHALLGLEGLVFRAAGEGAQLSESTRARSAAKQTGKKVHPVHAQRTCRVSSCSRRQRTMTGQQTYNKRRIFPLRVRRLAALPPHSARPQRPKPSAPKNVCDFSRSALLLVIRSGKEGGERPCFSLSLWQSTVQRTRAQSKLSNVS